LKWQGSATAQQREKGCMRHKKLMTKRPMTSENYVRTCHLGTKVHVNYQIAAIHAELYARKVIYNNVKTIGIV
jgi:hypothetical protein